MIKKIEAEFSSVDLAERAARQLREKVPEVSAVFIQPVRSHYPEHSKNWAWTGEAVLGAGMPNNSTGMANSFSGTMNNFTSPMVIREYLPVLDYSEGETEPDLRENAYISCLTAEEAVQQTSGALRNMGGLNVKIY